MLHGRRFSIVVLLFGAFLSMGLKDPYLQSGKTQLQKAQARLIVTEKDKAGCRDRALGWVYAAIAEADKGMKSSHHAASSSNYSNVTIPGSDNLTKTLGYLKQAKENLGGAREDAGGHRNKAVEFTDKAIVEVEKALATAN